MSARARHAQFSIGSDPYHIHCEILVIVETVIVDSADFRMDAYLHSGIVTAPGVTIVTARHDPIPSDQYRPVLNSHRRLCSFDRGFFKEIVRILNIRADLVTRHARFDFRVRNEMFVVLC